MKAMDLPMGKFRDKGVPIDNVSNYDSARESIVYAASQSDLNLYRVIFATRQAMLKVVDGSEFETGKRTVAATKLGEEDRVLLAEPIEGSEQLVLQSQEGYFLRFSISEVPEKKKGAIGVRGMRLGANDCLESAYLYRTGTEQTITYKEKPVTLNRLKLGSRDTKGVKIRV